MRPRLTTVPGDLDGRAAHLGVTAARLAGHGTVTTQMRAFAAAVADAEELTDCVLFGCDWGDPEPAAGATVRRCRRDGCPWALRVTDVSGPQPILTATLAHHPSAEENARERPYRDRRATPSPALRVVHP